MTQPPPRHPVALGTAHLPVFRALAWLLSKFGIAHVWLMYTKDLTVPIPPYRAKIPIDIGMAGDADMDELAALYHHREPDQVAGRARIYRDRLRGGSLCFVARIDGAIVSSNWIRVRTAVGADQMRMHFGDDEVYTTDAYTDPAWRAQGIHPALNQTQLEYARQQGYRIAYTLVRADNERSSITMGRVGWQLAGTMLIFLPSWSSRRTFWQVWGDPYPMPLARGFSVLTADAEESSQEATAAEADSAAHHLLRFSQREPAGDRPWGRTYRLRDGDETAWLKIVPVEHAGVLQASVLLAAAHPGAVPEVIACDHRQHGWLLVRDHRGQALGTDAAPQDLLALVASYATLQAASASNASLLACLPAAPLAQSVSALLGFLDPGRTEPDGQGRVGAAWFVGATEASARLAMVQQAAPRLTEWLATAEALPVTINHRDLQPGHAAKTADGRIVLFNWARASRGPAGLSLHRLFGGVVPALDALRSTRHRGSADDLPTRMMDGYVDTLAGAGYAERADLRSGLPAAIVAGPVVDLLRFADYATDDAAQREMLREQLLAELRELGAICARLDAADGG